MIIESKFTTKKKQSESKKEKDEIWAKIAKAVDGAYTPQQVQKFYENARTRAIDKERKNLSECKKTGGGPAVITKLSPFVEVILSFANRSEPLKNVLDSSNPHVIEETDQIDLSTPKQKRSKLEQMTLSSTTNQSRKASMATSPSSQFLNILKTTVLCTQGLAEAQRF